MTCSQYMTVRAAGALSSSGPRRREQDPACQQQQGSRQQDIADPHRPPVAALERIAEVDGGKRRNGTISTNPSTRWPRNMYW